MDPAQVILAIPFFLPGHIIPLLRLCKYLVESTNSRVILLKIPEKEGESPSTQGGVEVIPCLKMPHFTTLMKNRGGGITEYFSCFNATLNDAIDMVDAIHSPVSCIICDVYVEFAPELASRLGVPWIALWTSTAAEFLLYSKMPQLISDGVFPFAGPPSDAFIDVPGLPRLKPTDYPTLNLVPKKFQCINHYFKGLVQQAISKSRKVLLNSVYELEKNAIDVLKETCNVIPVGPLHLLDKEAATNDQDEQILQWLDQMPKCSVIYVAFGTTLPISPEQFTEVAFGIEASGLNFLWAVRDDSLIPEDFRERTSARGLVVPWAPQMKVLKHPSMAGFFTHCGWNSTLEAISAGVPMVTRPLIGDQALTRKFVVDEWGIGLGLAGGEYIASVVKRDDIKRALEEVSECHALRSRVKEMSDMVIKATLEKGSSRYGLTQLLIDL